MRASFLAVRPETGTEALGIAFVDSDGDFQTMDDSMALYGDTGAQAVADGVDGDKGIYSTVRDMYRWDQSFYNNTLLNKETLAMAYSPYSFEKAGHKNYGLGWRMINKPDNKVIYHNGWWHGNNTVFYRFVEENFTIIMLGNKYNSGIYKQAPIIYSLVKGTPVNREFDSEE